MATALAGLGLKFDFLRGVYGRQGEHLAVSRYNEAATLRYFGHKLNPGEIGCYASHYTAWQRCVELGEPLLIMEDDVQLNSRFPDAAAQAEHIIDRCRLLRLAALSERRSLEQEELAGEYRLARLEKGGMGTQCYALSPEGARVLLAHSNIWTAPVDYFLDAFWRHGLLSYALLPYRVSHIEPGNNATDIGERQSYGPSGLSDYRRHWSKQRNWVLRKVYNLTHRRSALHPS